MQRRFTSFIFVVGLLLSLKIMWYKKQECDFGDYIDGNGQRQQLATASSIFCRAGQVPEEVGWFFFADEEACLAAWGLQPANG